MRTCPESSYDRWNISVVRHRESITVKQVMVETANFPNDDFNITNRKIIKD
jgi:hypothetical protein